MADEASDDEAAWRDLVAQYSIPTAAEGGPLVAAEQKIKGKRGASISLPGQDQDQIRRLRRVQFEEFSGICRKEKQAREQQHKEHRAELWTRGHFHERLVLR